MSTCHECGATLGVGRYCTNCGAAIAPTPEQPGEATLERTAIRPALGREDGDTAERPRVVPPPPPPAPPAEPTGYAGRFPLFADQVAPDQELIPTRHDGEHRRRRPVGWIVLAAVLLVALVGTVLVLDDDDHPADDTARNASSGDSAEAGDSLPPSEGGDGEKGESVDPDDLAPHTRVKGPEPLKPGTDLNGNRVTYPPTNMLDDDPETAYRMPGDASGASITFTLPQETTVDGVGLVNGYAKLDTTGGQTVDWYAKNRRITEVEWVFDDGTTVTQDLDDDPELQTVGVDGVTTKKIELRIISVSAPGPQPRSRNTTAISDVLIHGTS